MLIERQSISVVRSHDLKDIKTNIEGKEKEGKR